MTNSKARHQEILAAANQVIEDAGGVERIDSLDQKDRRLLFRQMAEMVKEETGCVIESARRNLTKALQRARHPLQDWIPRGGPDRGQGRHPLPEDEKRVAVSTKLAPGSKELAIAIKEIKGLDGLGHSIDQALIRWVESDRELKVELAHMGIVVKANGCEDKSVEY